MKDTKFKKDDQGKLRYRLIQPLFLKGLCEVLTFGGNHYGDDNWRKCDDPWRYYDPLWRHVMAWVEGERSDPDTGFHHLLHATCCLMFLWWMDVKTGRKPTAEGP